MHAPDYLLSLPPAATRATVPAVLRALLMPPRRDVARVIRAQRAFAYVSRPRHALPLLPPAMLPSPDRGPRHVLAPREHFDAYTPRAPSMPSAHARLL